VLVTTISHNSRGEPYQVTDPKATVNRAWLDLGSSQGPVGEIQGEEGEKITRRSMSRERILIQSRSRLTLWAAIVVERVGFDREEALSLGKAVPGLTAQQGTPARDICSNP
jgi:hypothetical protein